MIQPFDSFPNASIPGLGKDAFFPRMFLDTFRLSHLPTDIILYGGYIFLFTLQAIALFFLVRHYWGGLTGFLAALFLIISPVQYTAYWFMFFKNAFTLPLMLTTFLLLERGSRFAVLLGILIAFSHHTTSIIFLATLALFAVFNAGKRKVALQTFTGTFLAFLYLHNSSVQEYLNSPVAVFMDSREYLLLSLPVLIFALFGITKSISNPPRSIVIAFLVVTAAFPIFSLPFYERVFIFTDIAVIIAAAIGLKKIFDNLGGNREIVIRLASILLIFVLSSWILINTYGRIQNLRLLISAQEIEELNNISLHVPPDAAILTSTVLAPWVHGWSQNRVITPGLLYDTHTVEDWVSFSNGSQETKIDFLKNFPRPLYIFLFSPEKEKFLANLKECVTEKGLFLFKYICN